MLEADENRCFNRFCSFSYFLNVFLFLSSVIEKKCENKIRLWYLELSKGLPSHAEYLHFRFVFLLLVSVSSDCCMA